MANNAIAKIVPVQFQRLLEEHHKLITRKNIIETKSNGIYNRYRHPVITADHVPIHWRYDLNPNTNPYCLERIGVNAAFNAGAIKWEGKYLLVVRVEGSDRKSYFAFAESSNGLDSFTFWKKPLMLPQNPLR